MLTLLFSSTDIFFKILRTKLSIELKQFINRTIDLSVWTFCTLIVTGYIFQAFGMRADFGPFQLGGAIATVGLFQIFGNVGSMIMDMEGDRNIFYYLTLPTSNIIIFLGIACAYAVMGTLLSLAMIPLGLALFWNALNIAAISWPKLIIVLSLSNIFFAMLSLAVTAHTKKMSRIGSVWSRFLFPMWFLGGFQFSWEILHKSIPVLSYVGLCNPITYIMEGTRAALLGQAGNLPWLLCCGAIAIFTMITWSYAYLEMKKHLDFV